MGIDERIIARELKRLSHAQPSESDTRRAIARARSALERARTTRQHNILWRIVMPTSLAAAVVIAATLMFVPSSRVNAAETLEQVAEVMGRYKGWIHMEYDVAEGVLGKQKARRARGHIHTQVGTFVEDHLDAEGERMVGWLSPATNEVMMYSSGSAEIRVGRMDPHKASKLREAAINTPMTLTDTLLQVKREYGLDLLTIATSKEGKLNKMDIRFPEDGGEYPKGIKPLAPQRITLWIDPATHLIRRVRHETPIGVWKYDITYGDPYLKDIYDLDVPRNAKIVDNRPTDDAMTVAQRLQKRHEDGFGDYIALMTETRPEHAEQATRGQVSLFAVCGESRLIVRHITAAPGASLWDMREPQTIVKLPTKWPHPRIEDWLTDARKIKPYWNWATDGSTVWDVSFDPRSGEARVVEVPLTPSYELMTGQLIASSSLPGKVWPTLRSAAYFGPESELELLKDKKRPGLIGLRLVTYSGLTPTLKSRTERTHWIDPSRDDMPIETFTRRSQVDDQDNESNVSETRTEYLEHAQLPDGRWYPKHWRETSGDDVSEYHLQIDPDMKLAPEWFDDPRERIGKPSE